MKKAMADYHEDMNGDVFESWFKNFLLPNLPPKSLIVMDNAKYHSRLYDKAPTQSSLKGEIIEFLQKQGVVLPEPPPTKVVLLQMVKELNLPKKYIIDEMARAAGHIVLRLPPYHCCLNAIEMVWSQVKRQVRRHNIFDHSAEHVIQILKDAFDSVTPDQWLQYVKHAEMEEQGFWERDRIIDDEIQPIIISLDEETDDEFIDDNSGIPILN